MGKQSRRNRRQRDYANQKNALRSDLYRHQVKRGRPGKPRKPSPRKMAEKYHLLSRETPTIQVGVNTHGWHTGQIGLSIDTGSNKNRAGIFAGPWDQENGIYETVRSIPVDIIAKYKGTTQLDQEDAYSLIRNFFACMRYLGNDQAAVLKDIFQIIAESDGDGFGDILDSVQDLLRLEHEDLLDGDLNLADHGYQEDVLTKFTSAAGGETWLTSVERQIEEDKKLEDLVANVNMVGF